MAHLRSKISHLSPALREASGWVLLAALVLAPLLYGTTSWWAERLVAEGLGVSFGLWFLSHLTADFHFRFKVIDLALLYLWVSGWWMALNAHGIYDPNYRSFFSLAGLIPSAPGSIDQLAAVGGMKRMTGLLAAFLVARSLANDPLWRDRLLKTMALMGISVALIGLVLKIGGKPLLPFIWGHLYAGNSFAFFLYHANAGAFLNLAWPLALAWGMGNPAERSPSLPPWFWRGGAFVILVAVQVNLSKAAIVIALLLFVLFAVQVIRQSPLELKRRYAIGMAAFLFGTFILMALLSPFTQGNSWQRWEKMKDPWPRETSIGFRLEIEKISLHMARDAGWWGFGPETFAAAFAGYQDAIHRPPGVFDEAHEDYLQTVIEWGIGGTLAWSFLLFGGLARIWKRMIHAGREMPSERPFWIWFAVLLALLGVLIHAGFDFPLEIDSIRLEVLVLLALGWSSEPA